MKQKIKYILIGIIVASYFACESDSNCGDNSADFARFDIVYINEEGEEVDSSGIYDNYYTADTESDSLLVFEIANKAFLLSPSHDTLQYALIAVEIGEDSVVTRTDNIEIAYRRINRVDSPDCPIDFSFTDLHVVSHPYDSAAVVNTNLTLQNNAPNIKFYNN